MAGMNRPQFSLRAILWVMLVVALLSGWWVDRTRLSTGLDAERQRRAALEKDLQAQAADVEKYKSDRDRYKSEYLHRVLWGRRLDGFNDALNREAARGRAAHSAIGARGRVAPSGQVEFALSRASNRTAVRTDPQADAPG